MEAITVNLPGSREEIDWAGLIKKEYSDKLGGDKEEYE